MGKIRLIVFEGADGAGKETQSQLLAKRLEQEGQRIQWLTFPDYSSEGSAPLRLYLNGKLGSHPGDVNAYAASTFFAVDRYISYRTSWIDTYGSDVLLIANRYTTSNMLFQAPKLPAGQREEYLNWLADLEYQKFGLPRPDLVFYLDLPAELSHELTAKRANAQGQTMDIHETDLDYQKQVIQTARELAGSQGWKTIPCSQNGSLRSRDEIAAMIYQEYINAKGMIE